jgi:hypothetical protein
MPVTRCIRCGEAGAIAPASGLCVACQRVLGFRDAVRDGRHLMNDDAKGDRA